MQYKLASFYTTWTSLIGPEASSRSIIKSNQIFPLQMLWGKYVLKGIFYSSLFRCNFSDQVMIKTTNDISQYLEYFNVQAWKQAHPKAFSLINVEYCAWPFTLYMWKTDQEWNWNCPVYFLRHFRPFETILRSLLFLLRLWWSFIRFIVAILFQPF